MDFQQLEKKYRNFFAPRFEISLEGSDLLREGMVISGLSVEHSLTEAGYFSFSIDNAYDPVRQDLRWTEDVFAFGKKLVIKLGYADQMKLMLSGCVTSVSVDFGESGAPQMTVSGYDATYAMMKGNKPRSWDKIKHADIASAIATDYGLKAETGETPVTHPKIVKQDGQSDYHFLKELADQNYFDLYVSADKLIFKPPAMKEEPVAALEWRKQLLSFSPEVNLMGQLSEVEVRGWNPAEKKEIVGKAASGDEYAADKSKGRKSGSEYLSQLHRDKVVETIRRPVFSQAEADRIARSILNKHAEGLVTGRGETVGIPDILPGNRIQLSGLGKMFSAAYYIEETRHSIDTSGYRTTFKVKENTV
jgi:phage protein D